jgi:16S rRNA (uracil1498-N3)-methyltransferase
MRTSRIFVEQRFKVGDTIELSDAPAHYLRNVLRLREGDAVILFNGTGGEYAGQVMTLERNRVSVHLEHHDGSERESPLELGLGIAIIKRDAMDNAIQKATELGVHRIAPIVTEHTSASRKSLDKRHAHWLQIVRSACEQCGRNRPPQLDPVSDYMSWVKASNADLKLVAHPGSSMEFDAVDVTPTSIDLLIGPEGGLDEDEVMLARASGFESVSLGPRILRADTAPVALISLVQARWGDLR